MDKRTLKWADDPAGDIVWCADRGHLAYSVGAAGQQPGLLITNGSRGRVVGVATIGDTLVHDGGLVWIVTGG